MSEEEEQNRFSLRKLSIGLVSVLVGVSIFGTSQTVKADTVANNQTSSVTNNAQSSDTQRNENAVKSTFSNDNQVDNAKNNLIQTQVEGKNDQTDSLNQNPANSQEANNSNDLQEKSAEKNIVRTSSLQESDNQSNKTPETALQTTQNVQSFNLKQNSQKLNQKELATNLIQDNSTQKDYTPDINAWTGHDDGTYYILDKYTPQNDAEKDIIVIPNEADFEKAGKSTNGHEVGISNDSMKTITQTYNPKEIHFSETNKKEIKAINSDWSYTFNPTSYSYRLTGDIPESQIKQQISSSRLTAITGGSLNTSDVVSLVSAFAGNPLLTDISGLSNWNLRYIYELSEAFSYDSSLTNESIQSLSNWNTSNIQGFGMMFRGDSGLTNLDALKSWNMHNARLMDNMFRECTNLVDINIINDWDYSNVSASGGIGSTIGAYPLDNMFYNDHNIQINIGTDSGLADLIRRTGRIDAFHNSSNQITTSNTKLIELLTNTNFQAQNETATAKRTITFSGLPANRAIPPIVQVINYTKLATAIIDMTGTSDANAHGKIVSSGFEKDWKLDTSKQNDDVIIDGVVYFKPVKIPHVNGYKAHLVRNKINPALFMVSFMAVPTENKPSLPDEVAPSKPSAPTDNPNHSAWTNLDHKVVDVLNQSDSGWTMPTDVSNSTYTVEVPDDAIIDLSDLVIAEPVHAQTTTQIRVTKRFKLRKHGKKHVAKHLKHRKKAVRTFRKYRL